MKQVCQSCGMPIKSDDQWAHNADGTTSKYCVLCYKDGKFLKPDITVDEMKKINVDIMNKEMKIPKFVGRIMTKDIDKLERWQ